MRQYSSCSVTFWLRRTSRVPGALPGPTPDQLPSRHAPAGTLPQRLLTTQQVRAGGKPGGSRPGRKRKDSCFTGPCAHVGHSWSAGRRGWVAMHAAEHDKHGTVHVWR